MSDPDRTSPDHPSADLSAGRPARQTGPSLDTDRLLPPLTQVRCASYEILELSLLRRGSRRPAI